jgi:hypothetical protein
MFYPYLRARQSELLAIRATAPQMSGSGKIVPLVEPVLDNLVPLVRAVEEVTTAGVPLAVIVNPAVGTRIGRGDVLKDPMFDPAVATRSLVRPTFMVLAGTTAAQTQRFLTTYAGRDVCLLHQEASAVPSALATASKTHGSVTHLFLDNASSAAYKAAFAGMSRVTLRDGFIRRLTNAHYPPDEFFSDDYLTYAGNGYAGCADYGTIGNAFSLSGGPPKVVAIHLTYDIGPQQELRVAHFLSSQTNLSANTGAKFLHSVRLLVRFVTPRPLIAGTAACQEFIALEQARHFPGLPKLKELSIRHHIELMTRLI